LCQQKSLVQLNLISSLKPVTKIMRVIFMLNVVYFLKAKLKLVLFVSTL
jgi:hypothetical protein